MFLQICVCPQWGSTWEGTPPRRQIHPGTRYTPLGPGTPQDQVQPPGPGTPPEMATVMDVTHPTGMHSCFF